MLGNLESDLKNIGRYWRSCNNRRKSQKILLMNLLKGEITVEQGKALNEGIKTRYSRTKEEKSLPPVQRDVTDLSI